MTGSVATGRAVSWRVDTGRAVSWRVDDALASPNGRTLHLVNRRITSVVLMVLGVIAIGLAIASATVWRPTNTATLTLPARPTTPLVISDAGVLDAVAPDVRIAATADDGQPVTLAVGRTEDVQAWVDGAPHTRITGLSS